MSPVHVQVSQLGIVIVPAGNKGLTHAEHLWAFRAVAVMRAGSLLRTPVVEDTYLVPPVMCQERQQTWLEWGWEWQHHGLGQTYHEVTSLPP